MPDPRTLLSARLQEAFDSVEPGADPVLRGSDRADYQANGALAVAKRLHRDPRSVAGDIVGALDLSGICETVEVSGPGFINLGFAGTFLAEQVTVMAADPRLGVEPVADPATVVVDYSAPNVAKEMHVGNLRSTIIGDSLCRILDLLGHRTIRQNHLGDWGTPFGMLIEHVLDLGEETAAHELSVGDLGTFYQEARRSFDEDPQFRDRARRRVVLLQSGEEETLRLWGLLVAESLRHFHGVYTRLGVLLTDDDIAGESMYNPRLPGVVADLAALGLLVEDEGARCVFPPGFTNRRGAPLPLIVQKSDGGYGYAATDLAAIRHRVDDLGADRILYVVGAPQAQHLEMCFAVARMAGWLPEGTCAEHIAFGSVLGPDHKMLKARSGDSVKLVELLDEAVQRAGAAIEERGHHLGDEERRAVARAVGIGAAKYADLSTERGRDYVFDWDRMLAFEGNTGPYLQYAHARIRSIFRRGGEAPPDPAIPPVLADRHERDLALRLIGFPGAVTDAAGSGSPSKLCAYLFELATTFTSFYEHCAVLNAAGADTRRSRLLLSDLTARVLSEGLGLLGVESPSQM